MSRTVLFDSPYLLGFDNMRELIERIARSHDSYPPYNVESVGPDYFRISIAVAGFTLDQLRIEIKGRHLVVTATRQRGDSDAREFLHRGIALRGFTRAFALSDGLEVAKATLAYGLLHIDLVRPAPNDEVRVVPIEAG